jgi:hypothetical protein
LDKVHYTSVPIMFYRQAASWSEAEFLNEIQTKVLRVLFLATHSNTYSFAFVFLFLQNSRNLLHISTVKLLYRKEENLIEKDTPFPMFLLYN